MCMFQCYSLNLSHPFLPSLSPKVCSLYLCLYSYPANRFISTTSVWSTGEGNGKPLKYSCLENPMNSMKRQNDRILKEKLPRSVGTQYATGDQWRNNSRKNEGMEPKKEYPAVDVTGDRSKVQCYKDQYCIGTWNVRYMNQGELEMVKRDGKSECRHSRNQRTKMDWNG